MQHDKHSDRAPWLAPMAKKKRPRAKRISTYVTMRDGARLAVDVHLPVHATRGPVAAILHQTRYFRAVHLRGPYSRLGIDWMLNPAALSRDRFVAAGYAWVDVCVRGSGASTGRRPCPWGPDEIADGKELVDWLVAQSWCSGAVGATGVSYAGTTSEFLSVHNHPAVRAIAPRFSLFDVYTDIAFPGGIRLAWFTDQWATFNRALDANRMDTAFETLIGLQVQALAEVDRRPLARHVLAPLAKVAAHGRGHMARWLMRRVTTGVRRVDGDDGRVLSQAVAEHQENFDVHAGAMAVDYRDDAGISAEYPEANIDFFSPHARRNELAQSGAAVFSYSGWFDGAYQHGAVKRFLTTGDERAHLILGPWDHGGLQNVSPSCEGHQTAFDQDAQLIRFFDYHLRGGRAFADEPRVRYFTMGEDKWKSADTWPPPEARCETLYLTAGRELSDKQGARGAHEFTANPESTSGTRSRWRSLVGLLPPVGYADRRTLRGSGLRYRTAPLVRDTEVTGHPVVRLFVTSSEPDAHLFVYLEDERPDGRVEYVTEGQLGARHRKLGVSPTNTPTPGRSFLRSDAKDMPRGQAEELVFDLYPTSWRFSAGHRMLVTIVGADKDHFGGLERWPTLLVHHGGEMASRIELPVIRRL